MSRTKELFAKVMSKTKELIAKVVEKQREGVLDLIRKIDVSPLELLPERPENEGEIGISPFSNKRVEIKFAPTRTVLHQLVNLGWNEEAIEAAKLLRITGSSIDALDSYGETPFLYAVMKGQFKLAQDLLNLGASVTPKCRDNCSIFHALSLIDNPSAIEFIAKRISTERKLELTNSTNMYKSTPLMIAAQKGSTKTIELLLSYGADVTKENEDGIV